MLPREAIRPLYRSALQELGPQVPRPTDPMAVMLRYCERILPLPPFDVWQKDLALHRSAYLLDLHDSADAPRATAPATLEARLFHHVGEPWVAHLRSFRDNEAWRGHISFERQRTGSIYRTALIFREPDPAELRERFLSFEADTLEAFLRSALP